MNLLSRDGCTIHDRHFIQNLALLFDHLATATQWQQDYISMYGRSIPIPRLTAWYGDAGSYTYSGITMTPHPWNAALTTIKQQVEASTGATFNSVLLNLYQDGNHSVSWHSDDEPELGTNPTILRRNPAGSPRSAWAEPELFTYATTRQGRQSN